MSDSSRRGPSPTWPPVNSGYSNPFEASAPPPPQSSYYSDPLQPQPNPFTQQQQSNFDPFAPQESVTKASDPWSSMPPPPVQQNTPFAPPPYSPKPVYYTPPQSGYNTSAPPRQQNVASFPSYAPQPNAFQQTPQQLPKMQSLNISSAPNSNVNRGYSPISAAETQCNPNMTTAHTGGDILETRVAEFGDIICTLQVRPMSGANKAANDVDPSNNQMDNIDDKKDSGLVIESLPPSVNTDYYDIAIGARAQVDETLEKVQTRAAELYNNVVALVAAETAGKLADTAVRIGSHFIPGANLAMGIGIAVASGGGAGVFSATCQAQVKSFFLSAGHDVGDILVESNREALALAKREGRSEWLRMSLCDQPVLLSSEQYAAIAGAFDPKKKERVLRELRQKGTAHVSDKAGNRFPILALMSKKTNPENVLLVTPDLSEKGKNKMKTPKPIDFKAGATKKNGEERGLIGTLVGTAIHLVIYPAKKILHDQEIKKRSAMAEDGLPEHGDYLLRHFIIVTLEKTKSAEDLPPQTLLMLPAIKSKWDPETQPLGELLSPRVGGDRLMISSPQSQRPSRTQSPLPY